MRARALFAAASLVMLPGCYSDEYVEVLQPQSRTGDIAGDYRFLAACTARAYRTGAEAAVIPDESQRTATVTAVNAAAMSGFAVFEVTFRGSPDNRRSHVEIRHAPGAGTSAGAYHVWQQIEQCSGQAVAQSSPSQR